jgi:hypothetical protein
LIASTVFATYASALIIAAAALAVGRASMRALGRPEATWAEPAIGLAVLALAGSASARAFDSGVAAALVLGALVAAALAYLRLRVLPARELRLAAAPGLLAAVLASLPFIASGRIGVLGVGINNDLAGHLLWAEWLRDQAGPAPVDLVNGYPVGPHSLAAALGEGLGIEMTDAISGLLVAVAALTALTALGLLRELPPLRRTLACALAALPYMAASTLGLGGFKETTLALLLLGFVVLLARLEDEYPGGPALWVPLGLLAAGALAVYSLPGLYWLIAAAGLLAVAGAARAARGGELPAALRGSAPAVAVPLALVVLAGAAELGRAETFRERSGFEATIEGDSKLTEAVSPFEALGAWPDGNFLAGLDGPPLPLLFGALGCLALAVAAGWWLRRGSLAVPLAVLGAAVIYAGTVVEGGLYVQAKALAVPAPLVMAMILAALLAPRPAPARGRDRWRAPRAALAVAFVGVAACSSFVALRDAVVAPTGHSDELAEIRERTGGEWTLYLTEDRFTDYELRDTRVGSPFLSAQTIFPSRPGKDFVLPSDFDSIAPEALDVFRWVLVTRSPHRSAPPPNLRLVLKTDSYELWERVGPTPVTTRVLAEKGRPGRVLSCAAPTGGEREALATATVADVFGEAPVTRAPELWIPGDRLASGGRATQTIALPPGRWLLSLQYLSPLRGVTVEAAGESFELPASLEGALPGRLGPFWRVGEIRSEGGPLEVTVRVDQLSALQRLLGVSRRTTLGRLAATSPAPHERVAIEEACGRFVDRYEVPAGEIDRAELRRLRREAREAATGRFHPPELDEAQARATD